MSQNQVEIEAFEETLIRLSASASDDSSKGSDKCADQHDDKLFDNLRPPLSTNDQESEGGLPQFNLMDEEETKVRPAGLDHARATTPNASSIS